MSFIVTANGDELVLRHPRPEQFGIFGIAWSLAQLNRFVGHAIRPYSVAEHSLLVVEIMERETQADVHGLLAGLMHDAHEFITNDVAGPAKEDIGPAWHAFEARWEKQVQVHYALLTANAVWRQVIKAADLRALATERRDLVHDAQLTEWPVLAGVEPVDWINLDTPERRAADWEFWRDRFLDKYHELDYARNALFSRTGSVSTAGTGN